MNEQTEKQLSEALAALIESAASVKDFALEQAPDVIQQLLAWNFTISLIAFLVCMAILLAAGVFNVWQIKNWDRLYGISAGSYGPFWGNEPVNMVQILLFVPILVASHNLQWLQIWIAPKVWLLEYAANLIK